MPRMDASIYAAHMDNVLKLARRKGGVSRPQIISELNVTNAVATGLIKKCGLQKLDKQGRTQFFGLNGDTAAPENTTVKQSRPAAAKAVAIPVSIDAQPEDEDDAIAELDAQIVDTRNALRAAAAKAGKALGDWATHSALVDSLRERMTQLAKKRMDMCS